MAASIFTYGSLMFPQVWERVVRGQYASAEATVAGYGRFAVRDESYPGMIAKPGSSVRGVVYFDVDPADVAVLDVFEGDDYRRDCVTAVFDSGGNAVVATYIYLPADRLLDQVWEPGTFRMAQFLATYCREKLGE